jgi:hypothetical protein
MGLLGKDSGSEGGSGSKRKQGILFGVVVVLLAAGVILIVSALPLFKKPAEQIPPVQVMSPASEYERALAAEKSGDTTAAIAILTGIVQADPKNLAANQMLTGLLVNSGSTTTSGTAGSGSSSAGSSKSGSASGNPGNGSANGSSGTSKSGTSGSGSSTTSSSPAPADAAYLKAIGLTTLLPTTMAGYNVSPAEDQKTIAVVTAEPTGGSAAFGALSMVELTVHDQGTAADAALFPTRVSQRLYPKSADSKVKVGSFTGYYGTNGQRLATVVFVRGRYVFELIATTVGAGSQQTKALSVAAASAFPASKP